MNDISALAKETQCTHSQKTAARNQGVGRHPTPNTQGVPLGTPAARTGTNHSESTTHCVACCYRRLNAPRGTPITARLSLRQRLFLHSTNTPTKHLLCARSSFWKTPVPFPGPTASGIGLHKRRTGRRPRTAERAPTWTPSARADRRHRAPRVRVEGAVPALWSSYSRVSGGRRNVSALL